MGNLGCTRGIDRSDMNHLGARNRPGKIHMVVETICLAHNGRLVGGRPGKRNRRQRSDRIDAGIKDIRHPCQPSGAPRQVQPGRALCRWRRKGRQVVHKAAVDIIVEPIPDQSRKRGFLLGAPPVVAGIKPSIAARRIAIVKRKATVIRQAVIVECGVAPR